MLKVSKLMLLVICLSLSLIVPVQAQEVEPAWTVWLYEQGTVTLIHSTGAVAVDFELGLPDGASEFPDWIAVSYDGSLIAYEVQQQLVVDEWVGVGIVTTYDLPASANAIVFHETDDTLALGSSLYRRPWGFSARALDYPDRDKTLAFSHVDEDGNWSIVVYDAGTNTVLHELHAADEPGISAETGIVLQRYQDDTVYFTALSSEYAGYSWNLTDNTTQPNAAYDAPPEALDMLPGTDEVLMAQGDTLYLSEAGEPSPIHQESGATLAQAHFVQNGERIAYAADFGMVLLEHDGTPLMSGFGMPGVLDIQTVPDGFVFMMQMGDFLGLGRMITTGELQPGGDILWTSETGTIPQIAFVQTDILR